MRQRLLLLAVLVAAQTAGAAVVVLPGPSAIGAAATAASASAAQNVPQWTTEFQSFLTSSNPDPERVRVVARALATLNLDDPAIKAQLAPLAQALQKDVAPLLASPKKGATDDQLEAVDAKLEVLNYPAVRALLPEEQQNKVGAASWAYNKSLWEPTGTEWIRKKRTLDETIQTIAAALDRPAADLTDQPAPAAGQGPEISVQVLKGDISRVRADAVMTTVQEKHLCRGGVNAVVGQSNPCFFAQLQKAPELKDGEALLARGDGKGPIENVLFVKDQNEKPLADIVYEGLKAADKNGLESVAVPAMRSGSMFGSVERSYREIVLEIRKGVERFVAEARTTLRNISFVVYNDERLAASLQNAFAQRAERERSLRTDLREAKLSGKGFVLTPRAAKVENRKSPIYGSLLEPWDLKHLLTPHKPVKIAEIEDRAAFSKPVTSVLNMPIKMPGSEIRVPEELEQFREFLQKIIDHEKAVNPALGDFYMYLTVDQNAVKKGATHRRPGVHIDGVQGARYKVKLPPEHLYSASDRLGTVFYDQAFDLTRLDPAKQHVHAELERQAKEEHSSPVPNFDIAFWDSYSVHRADVALEDFVRTFIRVEFSKKQYDSEGDTHNPLFDYDWTPVARPIPAYLDDKPLAPSPLELGPLREPGPGRALLRRLKAYGQGLFFQFWWNVGPPVRRVWREYSDRLERHRVEGREPAVKDPRAFFRGLRLLGTTGRIAGSAGFVAGDEVVLTEARALFAKHVNAGKEAASAFERFLQRSVRYNPGKRRTKARSMIVYHMKEGSTLPAGELAAYYGGLARDEEALAAYRLSQDAIMADFKKTADRLILEANKTAPVGRRVLGALIFGSFANGSIRPGSDIDLQFITEDGSAPPGGGLPAALEREWAKLSAIKLEIISFTYVPPDDALLAQLHPEPILIVSPYADVQRRLSRKLPLPLPEPARVVTPAGRLVRAAFGLWLRALLWTVDILDARKLETLAPGVPHTIKDVPRYVLENMGRDVVDAKDKADVGFYIVEGDSGEARRRLEARGWKLDAPLEKAAGFHQVRWATTPRGGRALVILRVNGAERMVHMRTFLELLGVPAHRVRAVPGFRSWKPDYLAAFKASGYVPDAVVYGLTDSAVRALRESDPAATIHDQPLGAPGSDISGLPMTVVELSDGRKVWIFRTLYGRLAGDLMEAVLEHGARRITVLGAAGSLDAKSRVGDWYTPGFLVDDEGHKVDLSFVKRLPGVPRGGTHLHVATPNGGTKSWLEKTGKSGVNFVDSELKSIVEAAAKHPGVSLHVAQVITEVMTGPNHTDLTETEMDGPERLEMVGKILSSSLKLSPATLAFQTGYDEQLAGVRPGVPHTLKDLRRYIAESVPPGVVEAKDRPDLHFYIVEGDGAEARRKLSDHGWILGEPLPRTEGFRQFYPATTADGRAAIVALHVNGGDRVVHIQSYLQLMGVPGERVHTLRGYRSWKKEYRDAFESLGYVPDGVVYGLPWTVVHRLLARDPSVDYEALKGFRRDFNPAPNGFPKNDVEFRPMKVLELADGRRFWFFMHLYGEQVGDLMAALSEHGARSVTVLGSAGSLDPESRVGDWVTPAFTVGSGGKLVPASLEEIPGIPRRGVHLHVPSPSVETSDWLLKARSAGANLVDVELKYILRQAALNPGLSVSAAYIISDVMTGPHHTDVTETTLEKVPGMADMVDRIVGAALGLTGGLKVKSVKNVPLGEPRS